MLNTKGDIMKNSKGFKIFTICMIAIALSFLIFSVKVYNNLLILLVCPAAIISIIANKFLEEKVFPKKHINAIWEYLIALLIAFIPVTIVVFALDHWDISIPFR